MIIKSERITGRVSIMISWWVQILNVDVITQICTTLDAFSAFQEALSKYQEVMNNLEFARELQKTFVVLGQDVRTTRSPEKTHLCSCRVLVG